MAKSQSRTMKAKNKKVKAVPKFNESGSVLNIHNLSSKIPGLSVSGIKLAKPKITLRPTLKGVVASLSIGFFVIWIAIGLFIGLLMVQGLRRGVFDNLLFSPTTVDDAQAQAQGPEEANLPGVGQVNVPCVRTALSQEAIQKIVESQDMSVLSDDEKTKLEPCITQKEQATPSAVPGE